MTSLEQLHSAHMASLHGNRPKILTYFKENAALLLEYYEGQSDDERVLHDWRMKNEPNYTKVLYVKDHGRCTACSFKLMTDICTRCGAIMTGFQVEEPTFEQRSESSFKAGYKRPGFLAGHLMKLKLPEDVHDALIEEFKKVEATFARTLSNSTRQNMLPYRLVIKKLLQRLNYADLADSIVSSASYENLLQQEACWEEIAMSL